MQTANSHPAEANAPDPQETREWLEALESTLHASGSERARYLLGRLEAFAREHGISRDDQPYSAYRNTLGL